MLRCTTYYGRLSLISEIEISPPCKGENVCAFNMLYHHPKLKRKAIYSTPNSSYALPLLNRITVILYFGFLYNLCNNLHDLVRFLIASSRQWNYLAERFTAAVPRREIAPLAICSFILTANSSPPAIFCASFPASATPSKTAPVNAVAMAATSLVAAPHKHSPFKHDSLVEPRAFYLQLK